MKEVLKNMKKILSLVLCLCMMLTALPLAAMAEDYKEPITLNVFSEVANFGGEQKGWFAKELKDRFNITLNSDIGLTVQTREKRIDIGQLFS